jgi:2',3'-cyclic-nucleotide 2'-phosphodiesterase (5'-nucleotidase family)
MEQLFIMTMRVLTVKNSSRYIAIILCIYLLFTGCSTKKSFEILYFSNLNGNIEACECYEPRLGGLHQIKAVVDKLRKENPGVILIDGGDTFNTYPFIELDQAVAAAYNILQPDIWIPGDQEFIEGENFLLNLSKDLKTNFLSGNLVQKGLTTESVKEYAFNNKKIRITSYIQLQVYKGIDPKPDISVKKNAITDKVDPDYYNILVFHGDEIAFAEQQNLISAYDLVLTAHQQSEIINLESDPAVIGGGADGEFLMHIILQENDSGFKISASKINIEQGENPDQQIVKIINDYRQKIGLTD